MAEFPNDQVAPLLSALEELYDRLSEAVANADSIEARGELLELSSVCSELIATAQALSLSNTFLSELASARQQFAVFRAESLHRSHPGAKLIFAIDAVEAISSHFLQPEGLNIEASTSPFLVDDAGSGFPEVEAAEVPAAAPPVPSPSATEHTEVEATAKARERAVREDLGWGAASDQAAMESMSSQAQRVSYEAANAAFLKAFRKGDAEEEEQFTRVRIFFGTDRQKQADAATGFSFTARRSEDSQVTYGECEITIPDSHKTGGFESPAWWRLEFHPNPKKHITLQTVTTVTEDAFIEAVRLRVTESPSKDAFIFVHGYNVSFEDAARRTGQFAYDLNFVGAPILYSWPSNGFAPDYSSDEANVIWTVPHLQRLLMLLNTRSGAERVHLIAHSMGNRAVCDALRELSSRVTELKAPILHQLVLAAPDIDAGTLSEIAQSIAAVSNHTTLYSSSKDKAIALSCRLHKYPRAGGKPILILPGFETVDASGVDSDWLAHSYFASSWPLLADIYELLRYDRSASGRMALMPMSGTAGSWFAFKG